MLDEVGAEADRLAGEVTLTDRGDVNADNMEIDSSTKAAGHCTKRQVVATCADGGPCALTHLLHVHFSAALTLRVHFALCYACYTRA